jgi:hypothetical protein
LKPVNSDDQSDSDGAVGFKITPTPPSFRLTNSIPWCDRVCTTLLIVELLVSALPLSKRISADIEIPAAETKSSRLQPMSPRAARTCLPSIITVSF